MPRVKRGLLRARKRHNVLKRTKGMKWGRKSKIKLAKTAAVKAGVYAYRDRRANKRNFRMLWNVRLNAALREIGWTYSKFINALKVAKIELDRKVLSDVAHNDKQVFAEIVKLAKG